MLRELVLETMRKVTSADAAYRLLRQGGYTFTRAAVREMWREVGRGDMWRTVINTWGPEKRIPGAWVTPVDRRMKQPVHQIVGYRFRDAEGAERVGYVTFAGDRVRPFSEVIEEMMFSIEEYVHDQAGEMVEIFLGPVFGRIR